MKLTISAVKDNDDRFSLFINHQVFNGAATTTGSLFTFKEHGHHLVINIVLETCDLDRTRGQVRPRVKQGHFETDLGQCVIVPLTHT